MVKPKGARANSWQDVADLSATFGIALDGWQELILEAAMGERSDRTWAAKRVGVSVPRQNGKSQLLVARALAGALLFGEKKIVVSAHQADTARESYTKLMEIIEDEANEALRARVRPVGQGSIGAFNRELVKFTNGAVIQFKARSGPGGKGFSADCLLLDEAQILGSRAWTSINSTMSAMPNPQVWLLGTPPQEEDDCYAFNMVRKAALDGKSTAAAWCEWSADPEADDYDPASEYTRWSANPAWNTRINPEVVQGEFETYSVERFAQDRLGQWRAEGRASILPNWARLASSTPPGQPIALGVAADVDQVWLSLGAAMSTDAGSPHLGSVHRLPVTQRDFFVSEVARIQNERGIEVLVDRKGPAAFVIPDLEAAGVRLTPIGLDEFIQACVDLVTAVEAGELEHGNYDDLNAAVTAAGWRKVGDRRVFARRNGDISSLEAVALALRGVEAATSYDPLASVL